MSVLALLEELGSHPDEIYLISKVNSFAPGRYPLQDMSFMCVISQTDITLGRVQLVVCLVTNTIDDVEDARLINGAGKFFQRILPVAVSLYVELAQERSKSGVRMTETMIDWIVSHLNPPEIPRALSDNPNAPIPAVISGLSENRQFRRAPLVISNEWICIVEMLVSRATNIMIRELEDPTRDQDQEDEDERYLVKMWRWVSSQAVVSQTRVLEICTELLKTPEAMLAVATDVVQKDALTWQPLLDAKARSIFASKLASPCLYGVSALDFPELEWPKAQFRKTLGGVAMLPCVDFQERLQGHLASIGGLVKEKLVTSPLVEIVMCYATERGRGSCLI